MFTAEAVTRHAWLAGAAHPGALVRRFLYSDFWAALAFANLFMVSKWNEFSDRNYDYYRLNPYITWQTLSTSLLELLLLAVVLWLLKTVIENAPWAAVRKLGALVLLVVLLAGLDAARVYGLHFYGESLVKLFGRTALVLTAGAVSLAALMLALFRERTWFRLVRGALLFLLPMVPINLAGAVWSIHRDWPEARFTPRSPLKLLPADATAPRFVWVIFDEWDHYLTFEGREAGLQLPEIERFRRQAIDGENALTPGWNTQESLPSLIVGRRVEKAQTTGPDELLLRFSDSQKLEPWTRQRNVFQRARELNVNAALIGFHHPYPRMFGGMVTESFALPMLGAQELPEYWAGVRGLERLGLLKEEALSRVPMAASFGLGGNFRKRRAFGVLYTNIKARALETAARPEIGFAFLHLPVPHPPGIYNRKLQQMSVTGPGNYVDNLALLDRTIGELRQVMEQTGLWDRSYVLLTSDHPLRGRGKQAHSNIPFLLKLPGQQSGAPYAAPFNTLLTQELVIAALRGELREPSEVMRWLDRERLNYPTEPLPY